MARNPKGLMGELVGLNDGYTSSKSRPVRIIGVTKTTVSVDDGGKRRTFMRSHWNEKGSTGSRFAAYLMSEEMLKMHQVDALRQKLARDARADIRDKMDRTNELFNLRTENAEYIEEMVHNMREMAEILEAGLPALREAARTSDDLRKEVWS